MATSLDDYRALARASGARGPVVASAVGRFPIAMFGLAILLYVQRATDSFAVAGLVSAASLVGVAVGSVAQGRVIDRLGPTRALLAVAGLDALAVTALVVAVERATPVSLLVALAAVIGLTMPALPGASRALWSDLVPPGRGREAAYTYEAVSLEVFFILGPAAAALLYTMPWAAPASWWPRAPKCWAPSGSR